MTNPVDQDLRVPAGREGGRDGGRDPQAERRLWLRRYHPSPDPAARLVCLPHSGGAAPYFRALSEALSPAVEAVAVQYPGRQDRRTEPLVGDLGELATRLAEVLDDLLTDEPGPFALFGHSMGALLAFEVARRLEQDGREVAGLFVSGMRAPSAQRNEWLHLAEDAELLREVRGLGGTEARLLEDEEIVRAALPVIRSDTRAVETYHYRAASGAGADLRCPVIALTGTEDPRVTPVEAGTWRDHTSGGFELHAFPGDHFYLNAFTAALGRLMRARLTGGPDE
ncbi:alpha/beta fold hydrolase [Kitasatospora sp. NPDC093806]|uniref:thioesterase II family protein n=1 Tax=Kitasatospora sp. NPDC093806 TaxID=3155075 RepID=UPI003430D8A1